MSDAGDQLTRDQPAAQPTVALAQQRGSSAGLRGSELAREAELLGVEFSADLSGWEPDPDFVERVPIQFARAHAVLGLVSTPGRMRVATSDLGALAALDVAGRHVGKFVEALAAPREEILRRIDAAYEQRSGETEALIAVLDSGSVMDEITSLAAREDLLESSTRAPVIKLVNLILFEAVRQRASDVHIQPYEHRLIVRLRIDGVLFDAFDLPRDCQEEIASRVKIVGQMNIAEKRLAQDGRASVRVGERRIDLRISAVPCTHGERIVIRLLDKSARLYTLEEVGMDEGTLPRYRRLIALEHGLILVTGPTGSGKSTTLYATLGEINSSEKNIITLEDPVEYKLEGISQIQVSAKKGMTFASGLRSVLRQDPDIVMVGEIRDRETAVMAIQSALTGHLVFSTLHTNDAASAVTRLLDLGIEPYLLASSLIGVLAQRLVRTVCTACAAAYDPPPEERRQLGLEDPAAGCSQMVRGAGCAECRQTGYSGRVGLFEFLAVGDAVRTGIQSSATAADIRQSAIAAGMKPLRSDGVEKVLRGVTTHEEVSRVSMRLDL